jgi:hypothetical protein
VSGGKASKGKWERKRIRKGDLLDNKVGLTSAKALLGIRGLE